MISQSWHKILILPACEIMFPCREESSLHQLWSRHKTEKIRLSPFAKWLSRHSWHFWDRLGQWFLVSDVWPIQPWLVFPWRVEVSGRNKKQVFTSGFSLIVALTPLMVGKTLTSNKDALGLWSVRVTCLPINPNSFSNSITATSTLRIFSHGISHFRWPR